MNEGVGELSVSKTLFYNGDEENGGRACASVHLTTADQIEMRKAYFGSVMATRKKEVGL